MELTIKTIEICRATGAKSIDITLNSKMGNFKLYLIKKIDTQQFRRTIKKIIQ
jgi:hypothetical protein